MQKNHTQHHAYINRANQLKIDHLINYKSLCYLPSRIGHFVTASITTCGKESSDDISTINSFYGVADLIKKIIDESIKPINEASS